MAKISELPAADPLTGDETVPLVQNGEMKQASHGAILAQQEALLQQAADAALVTINQKVFDSAANADLAAGYASATAAAAVSNLFSVFSQIRANPPLTASTVLATGWSIDNTAPADLSLGALYVVRQGFNRSALPCFWVDTVYRTKRVRQAYPNQAAFTATGEALSEGLYLTDCIVGLPNVSTRAPLTAIVNWFMPARLLVQNSIHWEIGAFHADARPWGVGGIGQQVACVQVRARNATTATAWQTVGGTSLSTSVEDANPIEVFQGDIDISAFADGNCWLEAKVYPWFGTDTAVLSSESSAVFREFSRRWFRKRATINYVYVASTGNDVTGVVSTDAATAAATPCLTVGGALLRARTALGTGTTGALDGLEIRVVDSVTCGTPNGAFFPLRQDVAGVVITRALGTARAAAIVNVAATFRPGFSDTGGSLTEGSLIFKDVSVVMGGAYLFQGEAARQIEVQFWNCNLNVGGFATTLRSNSHIRFWGVQGTNFHSTTVAQSANGQIRIMRGLTADLNNGGYEGWVTVGCRLTRASSPAYSDATKNGHIIYNNVFLNPNQNSSGVLLFAGNTAALNGVDLGSVAIVQNLVELIGTQGNSSMRVAGDSDKGNLTHAVICHNTCTGVEAAGRGNLCYDEDPATARSHHNVMFKGNLLPQINVKGDDYSLIQNGARTGQFEFEHGVRCSGNFTRDVNANGGGVSFGQAYPGIGSVIAGGDPLFTDNQSVTKPAGAFVAGAGGGTYTLQAGSPARNLQPYPLLGRDITGALRGTGAQHAGAYQA